MSLDWLWIFKTPVSDWVKYLKNRMATSKYVIKGECKKCGKCCENILFSDEKGYIKTEEEFSALKKRNLRYHHFFIAGKMEGESPDPKDSRGALLFKCKSLDENKQCKQYYFRSFYCRDYPSINKTFISRGGETLDGCGFYFDVNKKFKEYLNPKV